MTTDQQGRIVSAEEAERLTVPDLMVRDWPRYASLFKQYAFTVVQLSKANAEQAKQIADALALAYASDDGSEYVHGEGCNGEDSCPACWAADIRRVFRVEA